MDTEIIKGGSHKSHHQQRVRYQPWHEEQLLSAGQHQPDEEDDVGHQAHRVHGERALVEDLGGHNREAGAEVVAVEAEDAEERHRDGDSVDGDGEHAVRARGQAAARHYPGSTPDQDFSLV